MTTKVQSMFSSFGRIVTGFGDSLATAREIQDLYNTPEHVFRARGTTRDAAVRAAVKRL